ncbi:S8 family serine peptidase [Gimesia fumaroli]|uniref:Serine protease AprX n=1 Tax=Gimesia fumaroli TaxID=2527976 RepID=A0A518II51_9PLAN|nr:S8 family serine peptidase [Gimesia fumaroli]QDV52767.1 Serine protease AprX [Gimesia fumaroli]
MNILNRQSRTRCSLIVAVIVCSIFQSTDRVAAQSLKEELCDCSPELTLLLRVNDVRRTAKLVTKAGGKIVYDPNLGIGNDIPFLVVNLPPSKLNDKKFIDSLKLPSGVMEEIQPGKITPQAAPEPAANGANVVEPQAAPEPDFDSLYVPLDDIKVPALRKRVAGKGLGEGTIVAIIDTGIDTSHPVFQDRVIFWNDATGEGRTKLTKVRQRDGKFELEHDKFIALPETIKENEYVFAGYIDEKKLGFQQGDIWTTLGKEGVDINRNGTKDDKLLVVVGLIPNPELQKEEEKKKAAAEKKAKDPEAPLEALKPNLKIHDLPKEYTLAFVDVDMDGKFSKEEAKTPIIDFNTARKMQKDGLKVPYQKMLEFPSRTKRIAYPLLFRPNAKKQVTEITIAFDQQSHGTHVAGIVAGSGLQIEGAAPKAQLMAIKVCSGRSCTDQAILRGIIAAFFNPEGYVPDVVNISLGSHEGYLKRPLSILIQDLSAKFGTTFFVSASNDGPGYRTINGLAGSSPAVFVGAHVSANTLREHYRLAEGVHAPEHGLLYFSSLGPSYTGEMRPNVVAPGSALSSTPLNSDGSSMFNGTSMSSPIAAGAAAAMLSLVKADKEYAEVLERQQKKIEAIRKKSSDSRYSLTSLALSMRLALENSAMRMKGFTYAQQGAGLIDIDKAYPEFMRLAKLTLDPKKQSAEFSINHYSKYNRLYDRSNNIDAHKKVDLDLNIDGEVSDRGSLLLKNTPAIIKLEKVEIQDSDGSVTILDVNGNKEKIPFSIALPGKEEAQGNEISLVLSNSSKSFFYSTRKRDLMETGKTYLAYYTVTQHGEREFSFLDVVHKPIELSDLKTEVSLPGLALQDSERIAAFVVPQKTISAGAYHRYPIAVTRRDSSLTVMLGFVANSSGRLLVSVFNPDGEEIGYRVIQQTSQLGGDRSNASLTVSTKEEGIHEVVVSTFSGNWLNESKYDLLIEAQRFRASTDELALSTVDSGKDAEKLITFSNSSGQVRSMTASLGGLTRVVPQEKFPILANYRTFRKLDIPAWRPESGESQTTSVRLTFPPDDKKYKGFRGRIDHRLYKKGPDGKLVEAYKGSFYGRGKSFNNIPRPEPGKPYETLYAAVDTYFTVPYDEGLKHSQGTITLDAYFPGIPVKMEGSVGLSILSVGRPDVYILKLKGPQKLIDASAAKTNNSSSSQATLEIPTKIGGVSKIKVTLPVTVTPDVKSTLSKQLIRSTLSISTSDSRISKSIPIEISQ